MFILVMQCDVEYVKGCYLVLCQFEMISGNVFEEVVDVFVWVDVLLKQFYIDLFLQFFEFIQFGFYNYV